MNFLGLSDALARFEGDTGARVALTARFAEEEASVFSWRGRELFDAASVMKVPVMAEVFRLKHLGQLQWEQPVLVDSLFHSIADDSCFGVEDEGNLRPHIGRTVSLGMLVREMIILSDNLATNLILRLIGTARVTRLLRDYGASDCYVLRHLMDVEASKLGIKNRLTTEGMTNFILAIATNQFLWGDACLKMQEILENQHYREMIPRGLPAPWRCGNKTGWEVDHAHDCAYIFLPDSRVLGVTILSDQLPPHIKGGTFAPALIRELIRALGY
jgi:beta-lactamase class A